MHKTVLRLNNSTLACRIMALVGVVCWMAFLSSLASAADPVEDLRQTLKSPASDTAVRDRDLKERIKALQSISDLRRALMLREWRDQYAEDQTAAVDLSHRTSVSTRFEEAVHDVLRHGDTTSRLAVMNMLAEMGTATRAAGSKRGIARNFALDLVQLTSQGDPGVREAAAHTLSHINPDPQVAIPALDAMLAAKELPQRLAASEGLVSLVRVVSNLAMHNHDPNGVETTRAEVVEVSRAVVTVAARGVRDVQPEIRRRSVEAMGQAADALRNLVMTPRALDEMEDWVGYHRRAEEERAELMPLIQMLKEQSPALTRALGDPDAEVRLLARRALEDMTNPQLRLLQRAPSVARDGQRNSQTSPFILSSSSAKDPLIEGVQATARALASGMTDPDPRARRAAIDVLETMGPAAATAATALVTALADPDQFVRWSAARTLGKISPVESDTAVPGLARLLADADLDVRLAAATALERYGPAAKAGISELIKVVGSGDAELRVAAIRALGAIGGAEAQAGIPAIQAELKNTDARVRQAAAQVLGGFGRSAKDSVDALRPMLHDSSPEVQKAASEALLSILQPVKK